MVTAFRRFRFTCGNAFKAPASILLCNSFINELIAESELVTYVCTRATGVHHLPIHRRLRNSLIPPVSNGDPMNKFFGF